MGKGHPHHCSWCVSCAPIMCQPLCHGPRIQVSAILRTLCRDDNPAPTSQLCAGAQELHTPGQFLTPFPPYCPLQPSSVAVNVIASCQTLFLPWSIHPHPTGVCPQPRWSGILSSRWNLGDLTSAQNPPTVRIPLRVQGSPLALASRAHLHSDAQPLAVPHRTRFCLGASALAVPLSGRCFPTGSQGLLLSHVAGQ